jgi:surfeit locus 1 family protein
VSTRIRLGGRTFAPSWLSTLLALVIVAACVGLGRWQWDRGIDRRGEWTAFEKVGPALPADSRDLAALPRYQRVELTGRYDAERQFLLDNRTRDGRAGFEVLTALELGDGRVVLVNRGWIPFSGYRDRLPDVSFESDARQTVSGRLDSLPAAGLPQGRSAPRADGEWPKLVSFPTPEQLDAVYPRRLESRIVLLDGQSPHGFRRDWRPPGIEPGRHFSYAVQWWGFATLAAVLWFLLSLRR